MADHAPVARFPALHAKVVAVVGAMLERGKGEARTMVSNLIKVEVAWLNTSHPNFIGGRSVRHIAFVHWQTSRSLVPDSSNIIRGDVCHQ